MSPWSLALAGWTTRSWARLYTTGLPRERGEGRRGEIASDLWEHVNIGQQAAALLLRRQFGIRS